MGKKKLHVHKMTRVEKCGTSGLQTCGTHLQKLLQTRGTLTKMITNSWHTLTKMITNSSHTHIKKLLQTRIPRSTALEALIIRPPMQFE